MESGAATKWAVRASTALFGFALGLALSPRLQLAAGPDDLLSAFSKAGFSPRGLVLQFGLAVALTALFAILGDKVARVLAPFRWAAVLYCGALLLAPVSLMYWGNLRHVLLMGGAAAAVVALRKRDPQFTRWDAVLVPTILSCYFAFLELGFGRTPLAALLRAIIAVFAIRMLVRSAEAMMASPLALLLQPGWLASPVGPIAALLVIFGAPLLLARMRWRIPATIVFPIVVFIYPLAVLRVPTPTAANFFEDSHNVPVATEMLRGELPYRDIVPVHGLVTDGLLDYAAMKSGVRSLRTILQLRLVFGILSAVSIYFLAYAATGRPDIGLVVAFVTFSLFPGSTLWMRPAFSLFALAAMAAGTRLRNKRWFIAAGALTVLAYFVSVDYGVYAAAAGVFAAFRSRALRELAIGVLGVFVPALIVFALFGIADDFVRSNLFEIFGGQGAGFMYPVELPEALRSPALMHRLANGFAAIAWVIALVTSCVALARSPLRARRSDAPWLIGVWMVVAAAAFLRRGNYQYEPAVLPFVAASCWMLSRYARTLAIVAVAMVVLIADPFRHLLEVVPSLAQHQLGDVFDPVTATSINTARRFTSASLKPDETFVDFANAALLYSMLNRDLPLRHIGVTSYQSLEAQRDVIATLERNTKVRAALLAFPGSSQNIDGITNAERAPLVYAWLQRNFTPAFDENGVVFWVRQGSRPGS